MSNRYSKIHARIVAITDAERQNFAIGPPFGEEPRRSVMRIKRLLELQQALDFARPRFLKDQSHHSYSVTRNELLDAAVGLTYWDANLDGRAEDRFAERLVRLEAALEPVIVLRNLAAIANSGRKRNGR